MKLSLAFSPCPNDTFIFDAIANGRIPTDDFSFDLVLDDILHLNQSAIAGKSDIIKVSYSTFGKIQKEYRLLRSGSAMGIGCGPLLVSKPGITMEDLNDPNASIAIPGYNTTANLLLNHFKPTLRNKTEMLFHEVMPAVEKGKVIAGVIIHENRFTYPDHGLVCLADLGEYWEKETGLPIPLGAIAAKRSIGETKIRKIEKLIKESVKFAFAHPEESYDFIRSHSQEMDPKVCQSHIDLYVNKYSIDIGADGEAAIEKLLETGIKENILPEDAVALFELQRQEWKIEGENK